MSPGDSVNDGDGMSHAKSKLHSEKTHSQGPGESGSEDEDGESGKTESDEIDQIEGQSQ